MTTTIKLAGKLDGTVGKVFDMFASRAKKSSEQASKSIKDNMRNAGEGVKLGFGGVLKTVTGVFAAFKAAGAVKDFFASSIEEAKASIDANTKLEAVMQNVKSVASQGPEAVKAAVSNIQNQASALQQKGVIDDDTLVAGFQQLATFQMDDKTINTLSTGMSDLLAQQKGLGATADDAVGIANMIGKVMDGSTGALKRVGISFSKQQEDMIKNGSQMERATVLAEVLKQNVGGVNEALAQTDQGKLQQANNTIGDLKENIGRKLLPIMASFASKTMPFVSAAFDKISAAMDVVSPVLSSLFDGAISGINFLTPKIAALLQVFKPVGELIINTLQPALGDALPNAFSFVGSAIDKMIPVVQQFVPMFLSYFQTIGSEVTAFLSPVISALQSVGEMLLPKIQSLMLTIGPLISALSPIVIGLAGVIGTALSEAFKIVGTVIGVAIDGITLLITGFTNLLNFIGSFTNGWTTIFDVIKSVVIAAFDSVKDAVRTVLSAIIFPVNVVIGTVNKVSGAIGGGQIPLLEVPKFAEGGTVNKATLLIAGEGKNPETIVPHNNKPRSVALLREAAAGVGARLGSKIYNITFAPVINAVNADGVEDALESSFEKFKAFMNQYDDESDREVFA